VVVGVGMEMVVVVVVVRGAKRKDDMTAQGEGMHPPHQSSWRICIPILCWHQQCEHRAPSGIHTVLKQEVKREAHSKRMRVPTPTCLQGVFTTNWYGCNEPCSDGTCGEKAGDRPFHKTT
jgi:hypothetical protein